ncbi:LysR family transcriptional regulator [Devosia sp. 919]|uniref:LysR family transcriptional regulator n=1 Tax=Devosia sp. 919 TaxID=2726065 RepID=UPI0015553E8C|nr:LysR family transcriptional regulator [Devosia sp. 919]
MSKLPDLEGLAIFAKVAEERSFARAARLMGLSVATVSRSVGRLEDRLGTRLFNRTSRQLALTDMGASLAARASAIYADAEAAENLVLEQSSQPRGLVRLAIPMSFGLRWVTPLLPAFFRQYPDVSIDLHLSDAVVDIVGEGFDAALRIAVLPDSSLVARHLADIGGAVVAAPAYLETRRLPERPADLEPADCLGYAYRPRQDVWRFRSQAGEEESVTPAGKLRVTNVDALLPMVLDGQGIAELPAFIADPYLAEGRLVALVPGWTLPRGALYFVTPSARARPAKVSALLEFLAAQLSRPVWS